MAARTRFPVPTRGPADSPSISGRCTPRFRLARPPQTPLRCQARSVRSPSQGAPPVEVRQMRTYDESSDRLVSPQRAKPEDEGGLATLVPGGRVSERPRAGGAAQAERRRARSKPLPIQTELDLFRARKIKRRAKFQPDPEQRSARMIKSEKHFLDIIERSPEDPRAYVSLGAMYTTAKRYNDARRILEEGCRVFQGRNSYLWVALGSLERKQRHYERARQFFEGALVADETHAAAWHGWAMLEKDFGNVERAQNLLSDGIRKCPDFNAFLYEGIATLAGEAGLLDEARYWYRLGTNLGNGAQSHALWTSWGNMEWKLAGDTTQAQYCFGMALKRWPKSRYVHLTWAVMEKSLGNLEQAAELLQVGMRHNPTDAAIPQAYGVLLAETGNYDGARRLFRRAITLDRNMLHAWQAWAVLEGRLGAHGLARGIFQKAVDINPAHKDLCFLWQAWGVLEKKLGETGHARGLFRAAVQACPTNKVAWSDWIRLEEEENLLTRAQRLRSWQAEVQRKRALPDDFSTLRIEQKHTPVMETVLNWVKTQTAMAAGPPKYSADNPAGQPPETPSAVAKASSEAGRAALKARPPLEEPLDTLPGSRANGGEWRVSIGKGRTSPGRATASDEGSMSIDDDADGQQDTRVSDPVRDAHSSGNATGSATSTSQALNGAAAAEDIQDPFQSDEADGEGDAEGLLWDGADEWSQLIAELDGGVKAGKVQDGAGTLAPQQAAGQR